MGEKSRFKSSRPDHTHPLPDLLRVDARQSRLDELEAELAALAPSVEPPPPSTWRRPRGPW